MQRVRPTARGLELNDNVDNIIFDARNDMGIQLRRERSLTGDYENADLIMVLGRDNLEDFGSWLMSIAQGKARSPQYRGEFTDSTPTSHSLKADITVTRQRLIEPALIIDAPLEPAVPASNRRFKILKRAQPNPSPITVPESAIKPATYEEVKEHLLTAQQTYNELRLDLDPHECRDRIMPYESAADLGGWVLNGLTSIQKQSIFR